MKFEFSTFLEYFIFFIIFIKILFIISTIGDLIISHTHINNPNAQILDSKFLYLKERTEFIFIISMAILLIYHFHPPFAGKNQISKETSFLFYIFGFILIFTANWGLFIKEAPWYKFISNLIKIG